MTIPQALLERLIGLLERAETRLPPAIPAPDWDQAIAYRWRHRKQGGWLQTVRHPHAIDLDDLQGIAGQRHSLETNTRQFIAGLPANNALLWGSRGTGKSSLIKALLQRYAADGLRLIEVEKQHLIDLGEIVDLVWERPERFILFCDDLSFEADDAGYKALKAVLDGSITAPADNILVYATSNRRHLLPEYQSDNQQTEQFDGEIHYGEAVEEKISLSERFGLWLSFYPFDQDGYLAIVYHWLDQLADDYDPAAVRAEALRWALAHGSRSGRAAFQFARDWAGRSALEKIG
jgi:predicted AAA+ superfamily ATPase